jgi:hypothetical protein
MHFLFSLLRINPLTPNDLERRRVVSPLKIKIPSKNMRGKPKIHQLFIQFTNYVWYLLHVSTLHCHLQRAFLVPSERCSIEEQSIEYCAWPVVSINVVRGYLRSPRTTSLDTTHPSTIFYLLLLNSASLRRH